MSPLKQDKFMGHVVAGTTVPVQLHESMFISKHPLIIFASIVRVDYNTEQVETEAFSGEMNVDER